MSLEATLIETNTLLKQLIAIATTQTEAPAALGQPEQSAAKRTRRTKTEMEADKAAEAAPQGDATAPVDGDPVGTRYWLIEKHNTVYAQKPGDPDPTLEGALIVSPAEYTAKKEEFAKKFVHLSQQTAERTTEVAATPAQSTPDASTASSATSAVSFEDVVSKLQELNRSTLPGHGRDGVMAVLTKFGKAKVPELASVQDNAAVLAAVEAILSPAADDLGL
jgi:hypothetical protein